jgi:hypothetical protein
MRLRRLQPEIRTLSIQSAKLSGEDCGNDVIGEQSARIADPRRTDDTPVVRQIAERVTD